MQRTRFAVWLALVSAAAFASGFERTLELEEISFRVVCANDSGAPSVTVTPAGLAIDNSALTREVDGRVVDAEVADLDADGSPEIYIYTKSDGSGSYGSLVAFAVNRKKSMSDIFLPPLTDDPVAAKGYMGHDEFRVVENRLVRRFPVYREGDVNAQPSGGMRQVQYKLEAGEAGWLLRADKVVDF